MRSNTVLKVEGVGKRYYIGHKTSERYTALRDVLTEKASRFAIQLASPFTKRKQPNFTDEFWALKDITFEVRQGDVVGIIGRNGAGKSTLLKILSRITEPTTGNYRINGRVASLLEVGTGFHPELTGRENIFLNGAILGMSRIEIKNKFEEIVDFAEIEKFLDTPVKRYSSGMYVRLAFAVAAHLEPEILLVDEVLAVGDALFQKKCLGKIGEVTKQGRTVLIVSHNIGLISSLCPATLLLNNGEIIHHGKTSEAIYKYVSKRSDKKSKMNLWNHSGRLPKMKKALCSIKIGSKEHTENCSDFMIDGSMKLEIDYINTSEKKRVGIGFQIFSITGVCVGGFNTYMAKDPQFRIPKKGKIIFTIANLNLCPGNYFLSVSMGDSHNLYDKVENAIEFKVVQNDIYGTGWLLTPEDGVSALHVECDVHSTNGQSCRDYQKNNNENIGL